MNERTSGQLEREADEIRAGIAETAEALQDKMSPGKMVDEFVTYMKDSDGTLALDNLRRQVRDNPMALAVIGSGLAWLMMGSGPSRSSSSGYSRGRSYDRDDHDDAYARPTGASTGPTTTSQFSTTGSTGPATPYDVTSGHRSGTTTGSGDDTSSGYADRARGAAGAATDRARGAAGAATDRVRSTAGGVADRARSMGAGASDRAHDAAERARRMGAGASDRAHDAADDFRDMADRGRRSVMDALDREPLVLGAIGLAVGAAIGAMLPNTRFEDETFGETRDSLKQDAEHAMDRAAEKARNVAGEAVEAAKTASHEENLVVEGKPITERVGNVAKAAASAGKEAGDREMKSAEAETRTTGTGSAPKTDFRS